MANYILKYKGTYRILTEIDQSTNDFVRNHDGSLCDNDCYISCQYGNKIYFYGLDTSKRAILGAYIPSIGRGKNICRKLTELGIEYTNYQEGDSEICFRFKAADIKQVAELMKAKTNGANISPFSTKNLPKAKGVEIPTEEIERYKAISVKVDKSDLLIIHKITTQFLETVLQRKYKKYDKSFSYKADMKQMMMGRLIKEYIYTKGCWEEYLKYLDKEIDKFYNNKN